MDGWIKILSQFTPEALFFEALVIFGLAASYAAFWIIKKRRLGVVSDQVPPSVVKSYLNELILDAQDIRVQLFGLLSDAGIAIPRAEKGGNGPIQFMMTQSAPTQMVPTSPAVASAATAVGAATTSADPDPALQAKITELQKKLGDQEIKLTAVEKEKNDATTELDGLRQKASAGDGGGGEGNVELEAKIKQLEEKLAEYSVIEDDLANLKRLQQENAQLKEALEGGGGAPPAEAAAPEPAAEPDPTPTPEPEAEAPAPEEEDPAVAAEPDMDGLMNDLGGGAEAAAEETPPAAEAPPAEENPLAAMDEAPAGAEAAPEGGFDDIVNQVDESLKADEGEGEGADGGEDTTNKSDEDLLSEFEKMLNS